MTTKVTLSAQRKRVKAIIKSWPKWKRDVTLTKYSKVDENDS